MDAKTTITLPTPNSPRTREDVTVHRFIPATIAGPLTLLQADGANGPYFIAAS
jgi:hypothetical protein